MLAEGALAGGGPKPVVQAPGWGQSPRNLYFPGCHVRCHSPHPSTTTAATPFCDRKKKKSTRFRLSHLSHLSHCRIVVCCRRKQTNLESQSFPKVPKRAPSQFFFRASQKVSQSASQPASQPFARKRRKNQRRPSSLLPSNVQPHRSFTSGDGSLRHPMTRPLRRKQA